LNLKVPHYLVARYGGEEFSIVLPNTSAKEAEQLAEFLRIQIRQLKIVHVRSLVDPYVTLSLGIASITSTVELSLESFIALADKALYDAKRQGRNRVVLKTEKNITEVLDYQ
jgi:diguanylate cyclase (GGDEF)-like protein